MTQRALAILQLLQDRDNATAEQIALALKVSERTVRGEIRGLRSELAENGAALVARPKFGYSLQITDEAKFQALLERSRSSASVTSEGEKAGRTDQLLRIFLQNAGEYIRFEDLERQMNLSRSSLTRELRPVREILQKRNLQLEIRPNHGMRLIGSEYDLRICIADYFVKQEVASADVTECNDLLQCVFQTLDEVRAECDFPLTNFAYENLVSHLYVALRRIRQKKDVSFSPSQMRDLQQRPEYAIARRIGENFSRKLNLSFPETELCYLTVHLAAKKDRRPAGQSASMEISSHVNTMVTEIVDRLYERYCVDFRNDLDLIMALSMHMVALETRIRFDLVLQNPILEDIRQRFQLAFLMTQSCVNDVIRKYYGRSLNDDEIAYLALHINLALERIKTGPEKKNLLIICATGAGTSRLLQYEYGRRFRDTVGRIEVSDPRNVTEEQIQRADYILSTIPLTLHTTKPVLQVHPLIDETDMSRLETKLEAGGRVLQFFDRNLFLPELTASTQEQAVRELLTGIARYRTLPPNFLALIQERERLGPTSFGTMVAFPHPNEPCVEHTFIAVGILRQPVHWVGNKVQLLYLMALARDTRGERDLPLLYQVTGQLLTNSRRIKEIIETRTYECLCKNLIEIEKEQEGINNGK